ncbi:DUF1353 domain-containing protein [Methyloceanibacter sp.]|uniref:DUF1353 domain-containing protein n=1 Tax=Methyloceanibacter sp. TaxID=1965321 RepID=UPI00208D6B07|nr:DUF1353 domain-containing protein [Methyloceanibacter sp.]GFO81451.1 MAG: hypothetical protein A49_10780 [Methyloceanibacter sp.]HML92546.1 DUF1353 domain-containing protein [Methyloceanibacter sp.]
MTTPKASGHYEGNVVAEFLNDGRLVRLVEPFAYVDPFTMRWDVPSGWEVDGASIPKPLWSLVGSPFVGTYRNASVIHDYYCDTKARPWGAVHRVFYDAMLTSSVHPIRARLMYAAVCWGGPRWSIETVNTYHEALEEYLRNSREGSGRVHRPMLGPEFDDVASYTKTTTKVVQFPFEEDDLSWLEKHLAADEVADDDIPNFVDAQIQRMGLASTEVD